MAQSLTAWTEEIVRIWRFTRNNGITEGFHRKMKLIQRRAYGFRNFNNYRLRAVAEYSDGRIISGPGCPGYRLFTGDALADADLAASRLESQGKRMIHRAIAIRRRFHHFHHASGCL